MPATFRRLVLTAAMAGWLVAGDSRAEIPVGDLDRPLRRSEITRRNSMMMEILVRMDVNENGMIEEDEVDKESGNYFMARVFERLGCAPRYPISIEEIRRGVAKHYEARREDNPERIKSFAIKKVAIATPATFGSGNTVRAFVGPVAPQDEGRPVEQIKNSAPPSVTASVTKHSNGNPGRFLTARERLPKGLPDWFSQKDADGDGQVMMSEFAADWTPEVTAEFDRYDLNHDGIITAAECLKVEKRKNAQ